jgi:hypothetical protein
MDDAAPKKRKPPAPGQQLKNVCDGLAEGTVTGNKRLSKRERLEAERLKAELIKKAEDYDSELDRHAADPGWSKGARKKGPSGSGHVM